MNTGRAIDGYSRFELSGSRPAILAHRPTCALTAAPRTFPYGHSWLFPVTPHRAEYSESDAQVVCDMLNERIARESQS